MLDRRVRDPEDLMAIAGRAGDRRAAAGRLEAAGLPPAADDAAGAADARRCWLPRERAHEDDGLDARRRRRARRASLGGILIDSGQLTPEDAERVLQLQKEQNLRFGAAAVQARAC